MKKLILFLILFISIPLFGQKGDYPYLINPKDIPSKEETGENALDMSGDIIKKYRKFIIKIAEKHYIDPDLLASVVFVETYGGGVSGWYEFKNRLSFTKQMIFGNATIGITQVRPENIRQIDKLINYNYDVFWQLNQGALQLASIRDALYPNTPSLSDERKMMILRYYNQGTKQKLMEYDLKENPVGHYALAHYKKNLRIRKRHRLENKEPYYSNEITVFNKEKNTAEIYVFNIKVASYSIGGSRNKANTYAWTAYSNRFRIRRWLKGEENG